MSAPRRPHDLLLDLGNVMIGVEPQRTLDAFSRLAGRGVGGRESSFGGFLELNSMFDSGAIDAPQFRASVCQRLEIEIDDTEFDPAWCAMLRVLPQTSPLVASLARRYRLFMLSNTDPIHMAWVRSKCGEWLASLSGLFLSFEGGVAKPDPEFFERALARFSLEPATCLFLDDRGENVEAARAVGIEARQVTATGLDRETLATWGLLPPRASCF